MTDWGMFSLFVTIVATCFITGRLWNRIEKRIIKREEMK